jgi:hypothetical protein
LFEKKNRRLAIYPIQQKKRKKENKTTRVGMTLHA